MSTHVLLFTPGVDSFISNTILTNKIRSPDILIRLYFDIEGYYTKFEKKFLDNIYYSQSGYVTINDTISLGSIEHSNLHIPNRNVLLVTMAQSIYNADFIYLNGVKDDVVSDNNSIFYHKMSELLTITSGKHVVCDSILKDKEKVDWLKEFKNDENKHILSTDTFSCFEPNGNIFSNNITDVYHIDEHNHFRKINSLNFPGCMKCSACFRKVCALTGANIFIPFKNPAMVNKYHSRLNNAEFVNKFPSRSKSISQFKTFLNWVSTRG
jgi:7-cyano-7-deazaguanine synthase in queuosine biosynthesis